MRTRDARKPHLPPAVPSHPGALPLHMLSLAGLTERLGASLGAAGVRAPPPSHSTGGGQTPATARLRAEPQERERTAADLRQALVWLAACRRSAKAGKSGATA